MQFNIVKEAETGKKLDIIDLQRGESDLSSRDSTPLHTPKSPPPAKQEKIIIKQGGDTMKCKYKELSFEGDLEECKKMIEYLKQISF